MLAGRAEKLAEKVQHFQSQLGAVQAEVAALDTAISAMHARVRPDALGAVNAWQGRYGERGALKAFLEQRLREAGATGVTTPELAHAVREAFGLEFETPHDWQAFRRNSVGNQLRLWQKAGDVEVSYEPGRNNKVARWRWVVGPTLNDLALLVATAP